MRRFVRTGLGGVCALLFCASTQGNEPLHVRIDRLVSTPTDFASVASPPAGDAEFLRRAYLDLAGIIPPSGEVRSFLASRSPNKRRELIERLLVAPEYAWHMSGVFDVMLVQREHEREDDVIQSAAWRQYLLQSFQANKPWSQLVSEMLSTDGTDPNVRPAAHFYFSRKGDMGRLIPDISGVLLGRNLRCAQCHDHPLIDEYRQADFFGLAAFYSRVGLEEVGGKSMLVERPVGMTSFSSTLTGEAGVALPRVFDGPQLQEPSSVQRLQAAYEKADQRAKEAARAAKRADEELEEAKKNAETTEQQLRESEQHAAAAAAGRLAADAKLKAAEATLYVIRPAENVRPLLIFGRRAYLAPMVMDHPMFRRNIVNRLWAMMMGRGLVEPLDLHYRRNPASHSELLTMLADEFDRMDYDLKAFLRELALTETYARSSRSRSDAGDATQETPFAQASIRKLAPEQLAWSWLRATGRVDVELQAIEKELKEKDVEGLDQPWSSPGWRVEQLHKRLRDELNTVVNCFVTSLPGEPDRSDAIPEQALFLLHASNVNEWLKPQSGMLIDRLAMVESTSELADELFLSVLSRPADDDEAALVGEHLAGANGKERAEVLADLAWSLLSSVEFRFNH